MGEETHINKHVRGPNGSFQMYWGKVMEKKTNPRIFVETQNQSKGT